MGNVSAIVDSTEMLVNSEPVLARKGTRNVMVMEPVKPRLATVCVHMVSMELIVRSVLALQRTGLHVMAKVSAVRLAQLVKLTLLLTIRIASTSMFQNMQSQTLPLIEVMLNCHIVYVSIHILGVHAKRNIVLCRQQINWSVMAQELAIQPSESVNATNYVMVKIAH